MKRSKFTDEQILAIVKRAKRVGRWRTCVARTGSLSRRTTAGRQSLAAWSSVNAAAEAGRGREPPLETERRVPLPTASQRLERWSVRHGTENENVAPGPPFRTAQRRP
jgi:hypothetical protein